MNSKLLAALALFTALAGASPAADTPATEPTTTQPTPTPDADTHWQDVLKRLGSAEFADRQAAQKSLDDATYRDITLLKTLAAAATDEEIKSRITNRVEAIEEDIAINPPPITLDVKNASITDLAAALSTATGVKMDGWPPNNQNGPTYTLSVKDKPFWEVFAELSKQNSLSIQNYDTFRLMQTEPGQRNVVTAGSLAIIPVNITRSKYVNLQQPPGKQVGQEQLTLQFTAMLDPRVKITRYQQPTFTEVIDDNGNTLYKRPDRANQTYWDSTNGRNATWSGSAPLTIVPNLGKTITSAKGEMRYMINLAESKTEITDIDTKLNQPIDVFGDTVTIKQFEVRDNTVQFNISHQRPAAARLLQNGAQVAGLPADNIPLGMTFIDANGKRIWSSTLSGGHSGGVGGSGLKGPVKIEFTRATKTKEVIIPFELKNLPLP